MNNTSNPQGMHESTAVISKNDDLDHHNPHPNRELYQPSAGRRVSVQVMPQDEKKKNTKKQPATGSCKSNPHVNLLLV
ncbi:MAG: hypothetical protein ACTSUE_25825 [Promethearchaeota archaeon]